MKKTLILTSLLILFLMGADSAVVKLVRLTIINKSGMSVDIKLKGQDINNFYYLRVPEGSQANPVEMVFTIVPDEYEMRPYYIEATGEDFTDYCTREPAKKLCASRNIRITFTQCFKRESNKGEPSMVKYPWVGRYIY
jgi:hypothetical protein